MLFAKDITSKNVNNAISFCLPYEDTCINLISYLLQILENGKKTSDGVCESFIEHKREGKKGKIFYYNENIIGVFCVNLSNIFLYCTNFSCVGIKSSYFYNSLLDEFNFSKIFAIMGEASFHRELLNYLHVKNLVKNSVTAKYILMIRNKDIGCFITNPLLKGIKVGRANLKDANLILPLQRLYEEEEICKENEMMSEKLSLLNLKKTLQNEIVFIATYKDKVLAKANTNARGLYWEQIGGVYTLKEYRRLLIGSCVVTHLLQDIQKKKNIALFVREENDKAIRMYQKLFFLKKSEFYITYLK